MRSPDEIAADLDLHIQGHESIQQHGYSGPAPYYLPLLREAAEALRAMSLHGDVTDWYRR